ncbi:MAG: hypothetical protein LBS75_06100 [Synergistaceae bacterium]|jgi:hypothetical protein|nr:hypothetical protein [Synergistaceae bacterium]
MKCVRCCFCVAIITVLAAMSAGLPAACDVPPFGAEAARGVSAAGGAAAFVGAGVLSNRDMIVSDPFSGESRLVYAVKHAACLFSRTGFRLLREAPGASRDASVLALKVYTAGYRVSVSEGGKNVKNVPSRVKNWQHAIDPVYLDIV